VATCTDEERAFIDAVKNGGQAEAEFRKLRLTEVDPQLVAELLAAEGELVTAKARFDAAWNALDAVGVVGANAIGLLNSGKGGGKG
jgi:hypothetical protein